MDWIVPETLAIGTAKDAARAAVLGFKSVVDVAGTLAGLEAEDMGLEAVLSVRLIDGPGNVPLPFQRAVEACRQFSDEHAPVLVACEAGKSRSVVVVMAHLIQVRGWTAEQARNWIESRRETQITAGLERMLRFL